MHEKKERKKIAKNLKYDFLNWLAQILFSSAYKADLVLFKLAHFHSTTVFLMEHEVRSD